MNIYVCIKQVPDTETKIKISGNAIDTSGIKYIMCPYDEFAVEEAIQFKEKNSGATVKVVSAGPERVKDALRTALAMGCDEAIHVDIPENADSYVTAKALAKAIEKEGEPHIVFTGKQAIDDDAAQVTQAMAEFMGLPGVTVVLKAEYSDNSVKVQREVEGGTLEVFDNVPTPCVIAAQKGMNEPRYASLPNIMKAKKKPIKAMTMSELDMNDEAKLVYTGFEMPPEKSGCKMVDGGSVAEQAANLVKLLHEEAKII